ncbi:MAG: acyl-CoA dehydratase activase [Bacillota bacterium]|nr:acyl-CoA dehydratase activase [Bacillota bacterium]
MGKRCFHIRKETDKMYLGIDVGSVSTDLVLTDGEGAITEALYLKTGGDPARAVSEGLAELGLRHADGEILGLGVTGSGRALAGALAGADVVKNEITAHAVAAAALDPEIRTVLEIGGQDSKIILLRDGLVFDFAMNTVCAAGTGSFLDRQAQRLGLSPEELGELALRSRSPAPISGRCAVFAESDLIHKQQAGSPTEDLVAGMCRALVRNYLSNVAKGKRLLPKVCFQGGVAANAGIRRAFEEELGCRVLVPEHHKVMGALGAALLAKEKAPEKTLFRGFGDKDRSVRLDSFRCRDCENHCQVSRVWYDGRPRGFFADRCGKYSSRTGPPS